MALLLAGCGDDAPDINVESSIPVRVEPVELGMIREYAFATGTAEAATDARLPALQSGLYTLKNNPRTGKRFSMGDEVRQGDKVIQLINPEFENQVSIESQKLNFDISKREYEKQQEIYKKGGITLRELTDAERSFIDAQYAYDNAKLQLAKLWIIAPYDGILVDLPVHSNLEMIATGTELARVMEYSKMFAEVTLPGKELGRISRDQVALITNYNNPGDTLKGRVSQVSPTLDPDSRMFKLTLEIQNDSLRLRPGMFIKADIIVKEKKDAVVIPKDVIIDRRGAKTVFVVQKGTALERDIELGITNRDQAEVISGLDVDESLVVEGFETLRNRSQVKLTK
jgi:RND family efflux transporter MFP subunit